MILAYVKVWEPVRAVWESCPTVDFPLKDTEHFQFRKEKGCQKEKQK